MSALAPTLQAFFTERLIGQRRASPNTVAAYRDTFRLLLAFAEGKTGTAPSALRLEDVDAPLVGSFLDHLEIERNNGAAGPATHVSPPSIRCSVSPPCATQNMQPSSNGCSRSRQSASSEPSSPS